MNLDKRRLNAYSKIVKPEEKQQVESKEKPLSNSKPNQETQQKKDSIVLPGLIKIPLTEKETPWRKVAKFLLLIGVDEAAKILARLSPEQTEKIVLEIASIRSVSKEEATVVLAQFESLLIKAREPSGGIETARTILETAFGPQRAQEMLLKAVPHAQGKPFDYLDSIDPDRLLRLLLDELPAVKALVLSQLKPSLSAKVIALMDEQSKKDTVLRLAKMQTINPEVLRRVDSAMREKVLSVQTSSADTIDGRSALAEILKRMDAGKEQGILSQLENDDPDLGRDLRDRLFTIDDILRTEDRYIQELLRSMSEKDIALLVVGKKDAFKEKIFSNVSKTRRILIDEESSLLTPSSRKEANQVTSIVFSKIRRAWENGECYIAGREDEDIWVQ